MSTPVNIPVGGTSLITLDQAQEQARKALADDRSVIVEIAGGNYRLDTPLHFGGADSGSEATPVVWRARQGETVRLLAGAILDGFRPVEDETTLQRLPENARGKVWQLDLGNAGISDFGDPVSGGLELFFNGEPLTLARWPNAGFTRIAGLVGGHPVDVRGTKGDEDGNIYVHGTRYLRWMDEADPWVHGYWFWDWADERHRVARIDPEYGVLELEPPAHRYGYRRGQWFYAYNLLCELDEPGEWYLDRDTGILYLWPPGDMESAEIAVSVGAQAMSIDGARHIHIQDLNFEYTRADAIQIQDAEKITIEGCTFRNLGGWGVVVSGGRDVRIRHCHIHGTGNGGIRLDGGDRPTLRRADHVAEDNHIHDYGRVNRMYQPAIQISGVGQRVVHNHIHHAPHMAIQFAGNDHLIAHNDIHHVCQESNDAGAIYSGRDWTWRGTVIRHNLLWEITGFEDRGCVGVYLDDMLCGTQITGNLFYRVTRAAMIGGGRDC
ncbi:MAG: right-handed parallel beta-helix repeat-containing protein, partial [Gemmatimonadetes bacterium]|nr:right-handed parallel beta-helix repeat-containing protein [Gemmatimonadota bacterium]